MSSTMLFNSPVYVHEKALLGFESVMKEATMKAVHVLAQEYKFDALDAIEKLGLSSLSIKTVKINEKKEKSEKS